MNLFHELKKIARQETVDEVSMSAMIKKAIDIATSMGGNMTGAVKRIEKIKKGLSKNKNVSKALQLANEETVSEKFKPDTMKGFERVTDLYVQFRGDENQSKKDFEQAKKIVSTYSKKHKLDIKDNPRNKVFGSPEEGSSAYKVSIFAKLTKDANHDLRPLYTELSKLKTAEDHGVGLSKPIKEETISEAKNLMPDVQKIVDTKSASKVGGHMIDLFTASMISQIYSKVNDQNKKKMENSNIVILVGLAQKMMQKNSVEKDGETISEKVEYAEYKFKNKNDAQKALDYFKSQQRIELDINDDGLSQGELAIDAGKNDMTKQHKEVLKKFKPKVLTTENATAQQAAIAIAKKKKNESVMDAYREMWEEKLNEETIVYKVKGIQKPEMDKFNTSAKMMKLKVSFKKQGSDTHVTMTGTKKQLRDFDSVARGKSSYGDPSSVQHFDEK